MGPCGRGKKYFMFCAEPGLVKLIEDYARSLGMSRSELLVASALYTMYHGVSADVLRAVIVLAREQVAAATRGGGGG